MALACSALVDAFPYLPSTFSYKGAVRKSYLEDIELDLFIAYMEKKPEADWLHWDNLKNCNQRKYDDLNPRGYDCKQPSSL